MVTFLSAYNLFQNNIKINKLSAFYSVNSSRNQKNSTESNAMKNKQKRKRFIFGKIDLFNFLCFDDRSHLFQENKSK